MPIVRYFVFVGSLLLALLFLADWYYPQLVTAPARAEVDRTIIRLHTAHKWPEAIVFDTSLPTIVPPPPAAVAENPAPPARAGAPRQAFALALPESVPPRSAPASAATKPIQRHRAYRTAATPRRIAAPRFGYPTASWEW